MKTTLLNSQSLTNFIQPGINVTFPIKDIDMILQPIIVVVSLIFAFTWSTDNT